MDNKTKLVDYITESSETYVELSCEPEDSRIEGNCSAIDPDTDKATADWIRSELESGNPWAWCCTKVTLRFGDYTATEYLGACSYKSEADFRADPYYADMVRECAGSIADDMLTSYELVNLILTK